MNASPTSNTGGRPVASNYENPTSRRTSETLIAAKYEDPTPRRLYLGTLTAADYPHPTPQGIAERHIAGHAHSLFAMQHLLTDWSLAIRASRGD